MPITTEERPPRVSEFPTYQTKSEYPRGTPSATIYFDGLSCFCFDGSSRCVVGINNTDPSHTLRFAVWKCPRPDHNGDNKATCHEIHLSLPEHYREVEIRVNKPVESGVYVYAPPPGSPGINDRYSYVEYYPDLEGPKFHDKGLTKIASALWPRFYINNGLFSAYKLTKSRFALKRGNSQQEIGSLALALAADIFLSATGWIEFIVDGRRLGNCVLRYPNQYEIAITNSGAGCRYNLAPEGVRNDFQLHYQALSVPTNERIEIVTTQNSGNWGPAKLGSCVDRGHTNADATERCDPTPCMGTGCGRTRRL